MDDVRYLTADQIVRFHEIALTIGEGGLDGIRSEHGLLGAVFQPQVSVFGEDAYPTLPDKAAAYGYFIAQNQPFIDGNKRTAALAMTTFLDLNGYAIVEEEDESIAEVIEGLGTRMVSQSDFFMWVSSHVIPTGSASNLPIVK